MSSQARVVEVQPFKTFAGAKQVLELYADRIIIQRTDNLAKFLPSMFNETHTIDLKDVQAVFLHDSKYVSSQWAALVLQLTNHKHITVLYSRKDYQQARDFKNAIDDFLSQRQPLPPAQV